MLEVCPSNQFKKDLRKMTKQGRRLTLLEVVIIQLQNQQQLPQHNRDYILVGEWRGYRECHIAPDWLLIYKVEQKELKLARTGSHTELFK